MTFSAIARGPVEHYVLVWIAAKNRATGATETAGFWTGGTSRSFTLEGEARTYVAAGQLLQVAPVVSRAGFVVQMQEIQLSGVDAGVDAALRGYDPRLAPVEVHVARFEPGMDTLLGIDRAFRGTVDKAPRRTPPKNESGATWSLSVASGARSLTRPLTLKRSDASQRARLLPDHRQDRFFRYADVAGLVERTWGAERT